MLETSLKGFKENIFPIEISQFFFHLFVCFSKLEYFFFKTYSYFKCRLFQPSGFASVKKVRRLIFVLSVLFLKEFCFFCRQTSSQILLKSSKMRLRCSDAVVVSNRQQHLEVSSRRQQSSFKSHTNTVGSVDGNLLGVPSVFIL